MAASHLNDDRLLEHYVAREMGSPSPGAVADHLLACQECSAKYRALAALLDDTRLEAVAEADEVFTADRLKRQQQHILRRLEHLGHPARVISFPGRIGKSISAGSTRFAPRWLAAAAAMGLFVGVAVGGAFFEVGLRPRASSARPSLHTKSATAPHQNSSLAVPAVVREVNDDDAFLSDLELALERRGAGELEPLDALTPHLRGISAQMLR